MSYVRLTSIQPLQVCYPKPETRNSKTRNPEQVCYPKPETWKENRDPKTENRNPKPGTRNPEPG